MKLPILKLKKAAAKRIRAREGPSEGQQAPTPKRPTARVSLARGSPPPERQEPIATLEVDLTADTPPEGVRVEGAAEAELPTEPAPAEATRSWGEGPSRAASRPPEEAPAGSPGGAVPEPTRPAEGSRAWPAPHRPSLMDDGRRAERLISQAIMLEFQEELRHLGASAFYREAFVALVRSANFLVTTREVINDGEAIIRQARQDAEEAAKRAEIEANPARAALNQLGEAEGAISTRDRHIAELESTLQVAEARAERAEERAARAEEEEREVVSLAAEREARAQEVEAATEARVATAEDAAEVRVAVAVEEFRASERFADELAETSADAYLQGFQSGKEKVARDLNFPQALEVELDRMSEVASDDEPAAADL